MKQTKPKIRFYPVSHIYKLGKRTLTSVTTVTGSFFEPFQAKKIARKLASFRANKIKKHGVRYWLAEWKEAAAHGTRVHAGVEDFINKGTYEPTGNKKDDDKIKQGIGAYHNIHKSLGEPDAIPEKIIYDEELGIAGMIDLLIIHNHPDGKSNDRVVSLYDWKSNAKLTNKSYDGKTGIKAPFLDFSDNKIDNYSLQLSLYAYLLERQGMTIEKLFIVHLMESKHKIIEVPYRKEFIKEMLKEWQEKKLLKIKRMILVCLVSGVKVL